MFTATNPFTPVDRDFIVRWARAASHAKRYRLLPGLTEIMGRRGERILVSTLSIYSRSDEAEWIAIAGFGGDGPADYRLSTIPSGYELREVQAANPQVVVAPRVRPLLWTLFRTPYGHRRQERLETASDHQH